MNNIFASDKELPIGHIIDPNEYNMKAMTNEYGEEQKPIPFYIIREATREEYLAQEILRECKPSEYPFYYEISID